MGGRNKALISVKDKTLIERSIDAIRNHRKSKAKAEKEKKKEKEKRAHREFRCSLALFRAAEGNSF